MPIYEGTSQIQALMAMKDTLAGVMKDPAGFAKRLGSARWMALSAKDPLERRVARIYQSSLEAQQYLIRKTATDKLRSLRNVPMAKWSQAFLKDWNPKRDFSYAMLHAERLTQLLAHEAVCEVLLGQALRHAARRDVLERYLTYAEPTCRFLADVMTSTGKPLLRRLSDTAV
jgi:hypothetical protein